jgi:hypothetical protein
MNRHEAYGILATALERHRAMGFAALCSKIGCEEKEDVLGSSGVWYTLQISVDWSDSRRHGVTIRGLIDDQNSFRWSPLEERIAVCSTAKCIL